MKIIKASALIMILLFSGKNSFALNDFELNKAIFTLPSTYNQFDTRTANLPQGIIPNNQSASDMLRIQQPIIKTFKLRNKTKFVFIPYKWPESEKNITGNNLEILEKNQETSKAKKLFLKFWADKQNKKNKPLPIKKKSFDKYKDLMIICRK